MYAWFSEVVSPSDFPSKSSMHLSSPPYVLRALPTSVLDFITRMIVNQIILDNYEVSEIYFSVRNNIETVSIASFPVRTVRRAVFITEDEDLITLHLSVQNKKLCVFILASGGRFFSCLWVQCIMCVLPGLQLRVVPWLWCCFNSACNVMLTVAGGERKNTRCRHWNYYTDGTRKLSSLYCYVMTTVRVLVNRYSTSLTRDKMWLAVKWGYLINKPESW
jgi:hypothetical protein